MGWTADREGRQLMQMVALLLSLAGLAERACRAPFPIRFVALIVLRPAEQVARELIGAACDLPESDGFDPASALHLAERFVALAVVLAGFAEWLYACGRACFGVRKALAPLPAFRGLPCHILDTS